MGVRIFGPTFGFVLGSFCTSLPIDIFSEPEYGPRDPRWIGAWWLGLVIICLCLLVASAIMVIFPKHLPSQLSNTRQTPSYPVDHSAFDLSNNKTTKDETQTNGTPNTGLSEHHNSHYKEDMQEIKLIENADTRNPSLSNSVDYTADRSMSLNGNLQDSGQLSVSMKQLLTQPRESVTAKIQGHRKKSYRLQKPVSKNAGFLEVLKRLLRNRVLMLRTSSSVLHLLPIAGFYTFLPKFLEVQFRIPVHAAAMVSGVGGIFVMGIGIFFSGFVIRKMNPRLKSIAGWIAFVSFIYASGMILLMVFDCESANIMGKNIHDGRASFAPICNRSCSGCDDEAFSPICSGGQTYFSPCHAGCSVLDDTNTTQLSGCECLGEGVTAEMGYCESNCYNLYWYIAVFSVLVVIHSTSEVNGMLLTLRCVDPKDKAMALGLISVAIGLICNVPCPIIYGGVVDSACIHWHESLGTQGACQIYDLDKFRRWFHGITSLLMYMAFVVDFFTWYLHEEESSVSDEVQGGAKEQQSRPFQPNSPTETKITVEKETSDGLRTTKSMASQNAAEFRQ